MVQVHIRIIEHIAPVGGHIKLSPGQSLNAPLPYFPHQFIAAYSERSKERAMGAEHYLPVSLKKGEDAGAQFKLPRERQAGRRLLRWIL